MKWKLLVCLMVLSQTVRIAAAAGVGELSGGQGGAGSKNVQTQYAHTDGEFKENVTAASEQIRQYIAELRKKKELRRSSMTKEERMKREKEGLRRTGEETEARLRKSGIWDTDEGRQATAMCHYMRGDYDTAIAQFTASLAFTKNPNVRSWIIADRGIAYHDKGDTANALKDYQTVKDMKAEDRQTNLARLAWRLGRIDDAKSEVEAAAAYQRNKAPGFVADWGLCSDLEAAGKPAEGCMTSAIAGCYYLYASAAYEKSGCGKYAAEMKYLQAIKGPGRKDMAVK